MKKGKRPSYEIVIVVIVVALAVVLSAGLYAGRMKIEKGNLLAQELAMFRSSLMLYKTINWKNAGSLEELELSQYEVGGASRPYLDKLPVSKDGRTVDPFGNPYSYNPATGWVSSTTPGYAYW